MMTVQGKDMNVSEPPEPTRLIPLAEKIVSGKAKVGILESAVPFVRTLFPELTTRAVVVRISTREFQRDRDAGGKSGELKVFRHQVSECDVLFLTPATSAVPSSVAELERLDKMFRGIGTILREGQLILYSGAFFPGMGREIFYPTLTGYGYQIGQDYSLGYVGMHPETNTVKVGGLTPVCQWLTRQFVHACGWQHIDGNELEEAELAIFFAGLDVHLDEIRRLYRVAYAETVGVAFTAFTDRDRSVVGRLLNAPVPAYIPQLHWMRRKGYDRVVPEAPLSMIRRGWEDVVRIALDRVFRVFSDRSTPPNGARIVVDGCAVSGLTHPEAPIRQFLDELSRLGIHVSVCVDATAVPDDDEPAFEWFPVASNGRLDSASQWDVLILLPGQWLLPLQALKDHVDAILDFSGKLDRDIDLSVPLYRSGDPIGTGWRGVI